MDLNYAIGVDIGGTFIKFALVSNSGEIINELKCSTETSKGRNHIISKIVECIKEINNVAIAKGLSVTGVGIGTPGIIDNGLVLGGAENLPEWESLPLAGIIEKSISFPVFVDNDANLMGLGEVYFGAKERDNDVVFLTVGTGIGGAMVLNGKLYGGHRNRGAELGHFIVNSEGEICSCGARGCLEAHASVTALIRDYKKLLVNNKRKKKLPETVDGKYIVEKYCAKEKEAVEAMNIHFKYLAIGVAGFINFFSPQKVVIGGGISEAGTFYIEEIRKRASDLAMNETQIFTEICLATLGNKAGCYGAAALVFENVK